MELLQNIFSPVRIIGALFMILLYPSHELNKKDDDHLFKTIFDMYSMNKSLNPWDQTKVPTWQSNPTTLTAADLIPKLILTQPPFLSGEDDETEEGDDEI